MFLNLARLVPEFRPSVAGLPANARSLFKTHPTQLSFLLDEVWDNTLRFPRVPGPAGDLSFVDTAVIDALNLPTQPPNRFLAPSGLNATGPFEWSGVPVFSCPPILWHHLIYAYLVESTGIVEIFAEVIRRLVVGETLGQLSAESLSWARATEQLFYRDPPQFSIASVISEVRPYERTNRRNAYWRMFGMDLAHPVPPLWAREGPLADWKAQTGPIGSDFRQHWHEFLRQVWLGVENRANATGPNPADPAYIALLSRTIRDLLSNRRRGGMLAREEFAYVSMLSWLHLTVADNTSIVVDLKAESSTDNPADRLAGIAQRVGMTPALRSRELFDLAEPMATVLRGIELGLFDSEAGAETLFTRDSIVAADMLNIINNWQSATGERVKDRPTGTTVAVSAQPLRIPASGARPAPPAAATAPSPEAVSANGGRR
jgi:hypothetical protein